MIWMTPKKYRPKYHFPTALFRCSSYCKHVPPTVNTAPPTVNSAPPTVNTAPHTVNSAPLTVNMAPPTENWAPPTVNVYSRRSHFSLNYVYFSTFFSSDYSSFIISTVILVNPGDFFSYFGPIRSITVLCCSSYCIPGSSYCKLGSSYCKHGSSYCKHGSPYCIRGSYCKLGSSSVNVFSRRSRVYSTRRRVYKWYWGLLFWGGHLCISVSNDFSEKNGT